MCEILLDVIPTLEDVSKDNVYLMRLPGAFKYGNRSFIFSVLVFMCMWRAVPLSHSEVISDTSKTNLLQSACRTQ